jgi:hypothetical protein
MKTFFQFNIIFPVIFSGILTCISACGCQTGNPAVSPERDRIIVLNNDSIAIGNAICYKNLQLFPVYAIAGKDKPICITLSDAISNKKATVKETGSVNQLKIDNLSDDYIFILAGDIVKGGRQDRTMGNDVLIAPGEKNVPLESYCVESGRWQKRGEEEPDHFEAATKTLASKELKIASRYEKDQSKVWQKVAEEQVKLNENLSRIKGENVEVKSGESGSSLQLTLENNDLENYVEGYRDSLSLQDRLPEKTIGFVYAINGQLYGADIFYNTELFNKLKQKLFDAVIVEAISEFDNRPANHGLATGEVVGFLNSFNSPVNRSDRINRYTTVELRETIEAIEFETRMTGADEQWIHRNYLVKSGSEAGDGKNDRMINE